MNTGRTLKIESNAEGRVYPTDVTLVTARNIDEPMTVMEQNKRAATDEMKFLEIENCTHFYGHKNEIHQLGTHICRSHRPRGLRYELSSLVRSLGSWVPIPLKAWMSVCVYSVLVLFCV
jgi:hypothetical protein